MVKDLANTRCAECAERQKKNGIFICNECFGQKCNDIDDCPYGNDAMEVVEEMTEKAKTAAKHYEKAEGKGKRERKVERKVDTANLSIMEIINKALTDNGICGTIEKELYLHFSTGGEDYTLKLTKHRKKKK